MKTGMSVYCALLITAVVFISVPAVAADNLGEILRESGCERLIGTWVDADTKGDRNKVSYSWRFNDKVIEIVLQEKDGASVSLMAYNPKTAEVFHVSADNQGGSSTGKWTFADGVAILELLFVTGDKQEGSLRIQNKFEDDDTMAVTIDLPEPIVFKMIRVKNPEGT